MVDVEIKTLEEWKIAQALRVYAFCKHFPLLHWSASRPYDYKLEILALVDWLVPTYFRIRRTQPQEEVEFWIRFAEIMDLWSHVPFMRRRPDNFSRLAKRIRLGSDLIPTSIIPVDRIDLDWRVEMDMSLHSERVGGSSVVERPAMIADGPGFDSWSLQYF
ncbi:hypothetical protein DFP72DRAFT_861255 [Ephemerocybe angulata]|uniref:Uncharacterized protein n=1 Tax=Ephemerocybe angulata TaxID=980116 RepID=A0A8H6LTU0_9AGAR|nr:hypothetical protein DFP72DRAFT_861255 [Tulosesus angulatus]